MSDDMSMFIDIPADEYHADKSVIGHSGLLTLLRSPMHYDHSLMSPRIVTPGMEFGTALHTFVLEPEKFDATHIVSPKFDRRKTEDKAKFAEWEVLAAGKTVITEEEKARLQNMHEAMRAHRGIATWLDESKREMSLFWTDFETGVKCRIRPDLLLLDELGNIQGIADVKSTLNASKAEFGKEIANRGYDLQAAFYSDGVSQAIGREVPFYFIPVESTAPHGVALYRAGQATIEAGRELYRSGLELLRWARANNSWPSYQPFGEEEEIDVPYWHHRRILHPDDKNI